MTAVLYGLVAAACVSICPRSIAYLASYRTPPHDGRLHSTALARSAARGEPAPQRCLHENTRWSTGNIDHLAADVAGVFGGQECDHVRDLFGLPNAAQRDALGDRRLKLVWRDAHALRGGACHVRIDKSGRDGVGGDAELAELDGQRAGETLYASLRPGILALAALPRPHAATPLT